MNERNSKKSIRELLRLLSGETLRAISRNLYKELDSAELGSEKCDLILRFLLVIEEELRSIQSRKEPEFFRSYPGSWIGDSAESEGEQ